MKSPRLVPALSLIALLAMAGVGAWWLADQHAHVSTSDARVRAHMVTLSPDIAGRLIDLPVRAGDRVARGDVVARLDERRAMLALAGASLDLKALEVAIRRMSQQADIDRARGDSRIEAARAGLDTARADISAARASLTAAQAEHTRKSALQTAGLAPKSAAEKAAEVLEIARQAESSALARLEGRRASLDEARAEAGAAELGEKDAERLSMEALALRQQIATLKLDLERHTLTSPINGIVDEVFADTGEYVQTGARIALAHATSDLWIEANIKETDIARVQIGAMVDIRLDATPRSCSGSVEQIGAAATSEFALVPNANPAGVFTKITQRIPVRVSIGSECEQVRPGAMASLRIKAD